MKASPTQILNGLQLYAEKEVLNNVPTLGKWVLGAAIGIASTKTNEIINQLNNNTIVKMMGIIDEDGMYDIDLIADSLKQSASKYGKMSVNVPMIGMLTFSDTDIDAMRRFILEN